MTIKLNAATGGGSVSLSAPNSTTSNLDVELTLPVDDGAANTFLKSDGSGTLSWASASSDNITEGNTTVECVDTGSDGHITFDTEGTERARVDSSGRILAGSTSARTNIYLDGSNFTPSYQFEKTSNSWDGISLLKYSNSSYAPILTLGLSKTDTQGANGLVTSGSDFGSINFVGNDGANFRTGARITATCDTTSGSGDMPGRLTFFTTADSASSPTERLRINRDGFLQSYAADTVFILTTAVGAGTTNALIDGRYSGSGVNTGSRSFIVFTNGNVQNTNNSYGAISDIKLKENIVDASSQWDDLKAIQVRNYNFKEETGHQTHTQLGVIAQEVELISPGLVAETPDKEEVQVPVLDSDGNAVLDENGDQVFTTETRDLGTTTKSVNYSVLYMKAVKALQEAMTRIEALETANASLEARLTALEGGAS